MHPSNVFFFFALTKDHTINIMLQAHKIAVSSGEGQHWNVKFSQGEEQKN